MAAAVQAQPGPLDVVADVARKAIAIAVIGFLLLWLAPGGLNLVGDTIVSRPAPSVGWGIVVALSIVLGMVGLGFGMMFLGLGFGAISLWSLAGLVFMLGGLGEATLIVGFVVATGFVAQAIVSYKTGGLLLERFQPPQDERAVLPLLVGALLFAIVSEVPVLGGLIALLAAVATLGAAWLIVRGERERRLIPTLRDAEPGPALAPAE